ncbi:MAG: class I SAM-dependent methyltransferase [Maricaulaceae bacterium]
MITRKHPRLLRYIQELQGERPWGRFLDAGTGVQSIRWVADLKTERWTAVSASPPHAEQVRHAVQEVQRADDRIVVGNWVDPNLLKDESYDTVMADYLLGAVEGFSPFYQPYLFKRLRPLTRKTLYVKGLEPYVPTMRPDDRAGRLLWEIGRFRDACALHGEAIPYREYPAGWVVDNLHMSGFKVRSVKHFDIGYKSRFVTAQIDIATSMLGALTDRDLADALKARGESLRTEALELIKSQGALRAGRNYVIEAEPV